MARARCPKSSKSRQPHPETLNANDKTPLPLPRPRPTEAFVRTRHPLCCQQIRSQAPDDRALNTPVAVVSSSGAGGDCAGTPLGKRGNCRKTETDFSRRKTSSPGKVNNSLRRFAERSRGCASPGHHGRRRPRGDHHVFASGGGAFCCFFLAEGRGRDRPEPMPMRAKSQISSRGERFLTSLPSSLLPVAVRVCHPPRGDARGAQG